MENFHFDLLILNFISFCHFLSSFLLKQQRNLFTDSKFKFCTSVNNLVNRKNIFFSIQCFFRWTIFTNGSRFGLSKCTHSNKWMCANKNYLSNNKEICLRQRHSLFAELKDEMCSTTVSLNHATFFHLYVKRKHEKNNEKQL